MVLILRIIKGEIKKSKRTYGFLVSILIPIMICGLQFLIFFIKHEYFAKSGMNPWKIMGMNLFNIYGMFVMPMYVVLIAYLINFTEHRANSWKYLFCLPIPKFQIYAGKIIVLLIWLILFCTSTYLLFLLSGQLLSNLRPDIGFQDYTILDILSTTMAKMFLGSLGILAIQFFLSIYWKDFIRPVGIGLGLTIAGIILKSWDYVYIFPYAHPGLINDDFRQMDLSVATTPVIMSIIYGILFFSVGYYLLSKKEVL